MEKKNDYISESLKKLGERFRNLRIAKGYSNYEQFAFDHNIPRAQYGRYEKGQDLRFSSLLKLLVAFDTTPEEFFNSDFSIEKKDLKKKQSVYSKEEIEEFKGLQVRFVDFNEEFEKKRNSDREIKFEIKTEFDRETES